MRAGTAGRLYSQPAVMAGLLPRVHSFTFIALGLISVGLFLLRPRLVWIFFWLPALLLALPQVINVHQHIQGRHFFYLQPGWIGNYQKSWPLFWLRNFGLPLLLIFPAWFTARRTWRLFYLPFAILFAFCFFVSVSPDPYNNSKLFYYWYALTTILIAGWLYRLATEHRSVFSRYSWSFSRLRLALLATAIVDSNPGSCLAAKKWLWPPFAGNRWRRTPSSLPLLLLPNRLSAWQAGRQFLVLFPGSGATVTRTPRSTPG